MRRSGRFLRLSLGVTALCFCISSAATGQQTCVPFAGIVAPSTPEYSGYQIKFTWVGEQARNKATLGVAGAATTFSAGDFEPCLLPASAYGNDGSIAETVVLSETEIASFIAKLGTYPEFMDSGVPDPSLSWQILRPTGPTTADVFEHLSSVIGARTVLLLLLDSLDPGSIVEADTIIRVKRVFVGAL